MEAPAAEPAPMMEEAPAEPAAPAPEARGTLTTADMDMSESGAIEGAPLAPETEETVEEAVEEVLEITELELTGTVTYVEPAEGGYYVKVENDGGETEVFLPTSVLGEDEPIQGNKISMTAESSFDGYEHHYVAIEIE